MMQLFLLVSVSVRLGAWGLGLASLIEVWTCGLEGLLLDG
jgi:hypothetical protein